MIEFQEDIALDSREQRERIALLKSTPFEKFGIHSHYFNTLGQPRHGISIEKAKEIYSQFSKIVSVSKRPALNGFKYAFIYKLNNRSSYCLIFLLDEKPMKLLNAYYYGKNVEKRLFKKYQYI